MLASKIHEKRVLELLGRLLGALGGVLERLGGVLERLGRVLKRPKFNYVTRGARFAARAGPGG